MITLTQIPGHDILTHSRMSCFRQCRRMHYYQYELGVRPVGQRKVFRVGGAVHKGLDSRAKGKPLDEIVADATAPYDTLPDWAQTEEQVDEWMVERETVAALLAGYDWYWNNAEAPPELTVAETIASEIVFYLPLVNPETGKATPIFRRGGAMDKIVKLADGRVAIFEHKTTGESIDSGSDYWRTLEIDQQVSNYFVAGVDMSHAIETVIYDVIRKPSIAPKLIPALDENGDKIVLDAAGGRVYNDNGKPRQSADKAKGFELMSRRETPTEFGARLLADIGERPDFYFARREIPRLSADLEEYRRELWQMSQDIRHAQKNGLHYRNTKQCTSYGRCAYLDHCKQGFPDSLPAGFERVSHLHPELQHGDE